MPTGISSTSAGIPSVSRRSVPLVVYGEDRGRRASAAAVRRGSAGSPRPLTVQEPHAAPAVR